MKTSVLAFSCLTLALTIAPLAAGCAAGQDEPELTTAGDALSSVRLAREYQGTIQNLPIMARFEVASGSDVVTGSYFYSGHVTKGEEITVKGTMRGTRVQLDEFVLGQKTGSFDGTVENGRFTGTWKKPDGSRRLPFAMDAIFAGAPFTVERKISDTAPAVEASGIQKTCELDGVYIEVFGLADPVVTNMVNGALKILPIEKDQNGKCAEAASDNSSQTVKLLAKNILVVETSGSWYGGGAHPLNGMAWKNISLTTGQVFNAKDVFKSDAKDAVLALLVQGLEARADLEQKDREYLYEQARYAFEDADALASVDFYVTADGIRISLFNWLAHALQGMDEMGTLLPWRDVKPLLVPGTQIDALSPLH